MEATHHIEIFHEPRKAGKTPDLLLRWEPALLVFFHNLFDTLLPFWGPDNSTSSRPALFWGDVFVFEGVSWWPMLESALWHLVLVAALWNVGLIWGPGQVLGPKMAFSHEDVLYYTEPTFPALKAAHPPAAPRAKNSAKAAAAGTPAMRVAAEAARGSAGASQAPPKIALGGGAQLSMIEGAAALPEVPMAATAGPHLVLPSDALAAIAPPPNVTRAGSGAGRAGNSMEVTVVAPPPELSGTGGRRGGQAAPGLGAVGPAPNVVGAGRANGKFELGQAQVVAPSPQLPMHQRPGAAGANAGLGGGTGTVVVAPAPTVERSGTFATAGAGALYSNGVPVVPPPPSIDGAGSGNGSRRMAGTGGGSYQVVPPAPSMAAGSSLGGSSNANGGRASGMLGGSGAQVVPPAPSVGGGGSGTGGFKGLLASLFGTGGEGSGAVPPAPSVDGSGVGGNGRGQGLGPGGVQAVGPAPSADGLGSSAGNGRGSAASGGGLQAVGPAPSLDGSGGGGGRRVASLGDGMGGVGVAGGGARGTGKSAGMIKQAAGPPPPDANLEAEPDNVPGAHELPVRIISLALALPNTSFFSNYEVFIAERRTKTNRTQLIKLVYESLPYEQRLSDYNLKEAKIYKLRVVRDHSCDETLIQMTWPDQSGPKPQIAAGGGAVEDDSKEKLPCYRTTAADYRKALGKK